jgi:hypothetical protein
VGIGVLGWFWISYLGTDHLTCRGGGREVMVFFLKKYILIPNVAEKNILILEEVK